MKLHLASIFAGGYSLRNFLWGGLQNDMGVVNIGTITRSRFAKKCDNDLVPFQKTSPTFNGCGSMGVNLHTSHIFTPACNVHDVCFGSCEEGLTQKYCDDLFLSLMLRTCQYHQTKNRTSDLYFHIPLLNTQDCQDAAYTAYKIVRRMGTLAFIQSTRKRCKCIVKDEDESDSESNFRGEDWKQALEIDFVQDPHSYEAISKQVEFLLSEDYSNVYLRQELFLP